MMQPLPTALRSVAERKAIRQAKRGDFTASCGAAVAKTECMPNEPQPARAMPDEDSERPEEPREDGEAPKKLKREENLQPLLLPRGEPREVQRDSSPGMVAADQLKIPGVRDMRM